MAGLFSKLFGGRSGGGPPAGELLRADLHSHLIPGIDDGSKSMDMSLEMIRGLHDLGYRKMITTPHVMADGFRNTPEDILGGLEMVRAAAREEGLDVTLEAAAEYYLDEVFSENVETTKLLTFGGEKKYLLFETSYVARPMSMNEVVFGLIMKGYVPVLAHPERYQYFWDDEGMESIRTLCERGVKMQVNISSFAGRHSRKAATIARNMAKEGLIDFLGTDLHRPRQLETIGNVFKSSKDLRGLLDSGRLLNAQL